MLEYNGRRMIVATSAARKSSQRNKNAHRGTPRLADAESQLGPMGKRDCNKSSLQEKHAAKTLTTGANPPWNAKRNGPGDWSSAAVPCKLFRELATRESQAEGAECEKAKRWGFGNRIEQEGVSFATDLSVTENLTGVVN